MITNEQQEVVDAVCNRNLNDKIIAVNACAGSGKTTTCKAIVENFRPKNGFYTAFNKAIVEDSKNKFGDLISCRTIHSLAYRYARPKKDIKDLTVYDIDLDLTFKEKIELIDYLDDFYRSKFLTLDDYYDYIQPDCDINYLLEYADKMLNGEINPTFSFLLKKLHMLLADKKVTPHFDLLLLDECQDVNGVMLEIFKLLEADQKVMLGDKFQNIYSFMNTINAFEEIPKENVYNYYLTKSFRCRPDIAFNVEAYGRKHLTDNYMFKGNEELSYDHNSTAYLCKLNSSLLIEMYSLLQAGKTFSLIRPIESIFEFPLNMYSACNGHPVKIKKYQYLVDLYNETEPHYKVTYKKFLKYIQESETIDIDEATRHMSTVLEYLEDKGVNLYDLKDRVYRMEKNPNVKLSTIHAFKGLEADTVYLNPDIVIAVLKVMRLGRFEPDDTTDAIRSVLDEKEKETLNLMYVGMSRARASLLS